MPIPIPTSRRVDLLEKSLTFVEAEVLSHVPEHGQDILRSDHAEVFAVENLRALNIINTSSMLTLCLLPRRQQNSFTLGHGCWIETQIESVNKTLFFR